MADIRKTAKVVLRVLALVGLQQQPAGGIQTLCTLAIELNQLLVLG